LSVAIAASGIGSPSIIVIGDVVRYASQVNLTEQAWRVLSILRDIPLVFLGMIPVFHCSAADPWHALLFDRLLLFGLVDAYCGSGALLDELMMQSRNEGLCMPGRIIFMRHIRRTFTYPHIRIQSRLISTDVPKRHKS
jgi:hypothetical protein